MKKYNLYKFPNFFHFLENLLINQEQDYLKNSDIILIDHIIFKREIVK